MQSALLEAMEERQVTMGDHSLPLPEPFFVLATQNPIEHEGTFRLPEAQLDRFMLKVVVDYPDEAEELDVVLRYLAHHKGRVISRGELIEHIYDQDFDRDSNTIEVFVGRLP